MATTTSAGALAVRGLRTPGRLLDGAGSHMRFYLRAYAQVPRAVIRHRREIWRLLGEVAFGSGALAVIGGTVVTVGFRSEERRVGKECVIRVDLGGRRIITKKKQNL